MAFYSTWPSALALGVPEWGAIAFEVVAGKGKVLVPISSVAGPGARASIAGGRRSRARNGDPVHVARFPWQDDLERENPGARART